MPVRVFQFFAIALISMNGWAGLLCCCLGDGCQTASAQCHGAAMVDENNDPSPVPSSSCHQQPVEKATKSSCHGTEEVNQATNYKADSANTLTSSTCACASHQVSQTEAFLLPGSKKETPSPQQILFAVSWIHTHTHSISQSPAPLANAFMVSDRWAPRLSALARLII